MRTNHRLPQALYCATLALLLVAGSPALAAETAAKDDTVGVVVAVRGEVTAQAPGGTPRRLECNDPIYAGDHIVSSEGAALGVMSQGVYAGMNQSTSLRFGTTETGTPDLSLEGGHLRMIESDSPNPGRIETPGLLARDAGEDTEALVFPEKRGVVSMVCPREGDVDVTAPSGGDSTQADAGQCAIHKPKEPVFTSKASHDPLGIIDDTCRAVPVAGGVTPHFSDPASDVALGDVAGSAPSVGPPIAAQIDTQGIRNGCDGGACSAPSAANNTPTPRPSPFPNRGPP